MATSPRAPGIAAKNQVPSPKDVLTESFVVTPSDVEDNVCQGILLSADGTIRVDLWHDFGTPTALFLAGGVIHPIGVQRVHETGTDSGLTIVGFL